LFAGEHSVLTVDNDSDIGSSGNGFHGEKANHFLKTETVTLDRANADPEEIKKLWMSSTG